MCFFHILHRVHMSFSLVAENFKGIFALHCRDAFFDYVVLVMVKHMLLSATMYPVSLFLLSYKVLP
jgi:hypothetical protein